MSTLISVHNSDGSSRRCDEKCYNATGPVCDCCCGGANHGKGLKEAQKNTNELGMQMIVEYEKKTGNKVNRAVLSPEQLSLLDMFLED